MVPAPFSSLSQEELAQARHEADAAMDRQRKGSEAGMIQFKDDNGIHGSSKDDNGILLGPKNTDKVTVGQPWGAGEADITKSKGLTQSGDGWFYACEYDAFPGNWRTKTRRSVRSFGGNV